jgi:hypothetical protein
MPAPGKTHVLEYYGCTNDRRCLGCFDAHGAAEAPHEPDAVAPAPGATRPAAAARPIEPSPTDETPDAATPPVLLNARWQRGESETDRAAAGEELRLVARAHGVTSSTATFTVRHGISGTVETVTGSVDGELVTAPWTASEPGAHRYDVEADGARATSPDLIVDAVRPPLKLLHIGKVLRDLLDSSRVVARWYLEDLSYEFLCSLAEQGDDDPDNDPAHMPRALCLLPGMEGDDVRAAQRALAALGHTVEETGLFDAATKAATLAWLPSVQPDRDVAAPAVRQRVAPGDTFAGLCAAHRVADWTDLWDDHAPGLDEHQDVPGARSYSIPPRAQRSRGRDLLTATGRETAPAYGGLAYISPSERVTRTLVYEDGTPVLLPTGPEGTMEACTWTVFLPRGMAAAASAYQLPARAAGAGVEGERHG